MNRDINKIRPPIVKSQSLPIVHNHNVEHSIGKAEWINGALEITLNKPMNTNQLNDTFGNCGIAVLEVDISLEFVIKFRLLYWTTVDAATTPST